MAENQPPTWGPRLQQQSRLLAVPAEILLLVFNLLYPLDLLRLRSVCTSLNELTRARITWLIQLHLQCIETDIPLCTWPFSNMSTANLEYATCRPYLFEARMGAEEPLPTHIQDILCQTNDEDPTDDIHYIQCQTTVVIPGGRFLITGDVSDFLTCWDTGFRGERIPFRMAEEYVANSLIFQIKAQRSLTDSSTIIVCVYTSMNSADDGRSFLRIFKLCLESSGNITATFERLTEIEVPGELDFWTLEGDRIFVAHADLIYMWDWKLGSIGVIRMGHTRGMEFPVSDYTALFPDAAHIGVMHTSEDEQSSTLYMYDLPSLSKGDDRLVGMLPTNVVDAYPIISVKLDGEVMDRSPTPSWRPASIALPLTANPPILQTFFTTAGHDSYQYCLAPSAVSVPPIILNYPYKIHHHSDWVPDSLIVPTISNCLLGLSSKAPFRGRLLSSNSPSEDEIGPDHEFRTYGRYADREFLLVGMCALSGRFFFSHHAHRTLLGDLNIVTVL